jgi:hypothetical protein
MVGKNAYRLLMGKPVEKRSLGRVARRWINNIKMDIGEISLSDVDWIGLPQEWDKWRALVNEVMNLQVL